MLDCDIPLQIHVAEIHFQEVKYRKKLIGRFPDAVYFLSYVSCVQVHLQVYIINNREERRDLPVLHEHRISLLSQLQCLG